MPKAHEQPAGPLTGLKVIELGSTIAGPFCARLMADFGADVIKVEQADGDAVRSMGQQKDGHSLYAASILRGKRLVSINLRTDAGRQLAGKLCDGADIVIENFKPGTLERWGLGYEALSARNPGLVMVRISGFGQSGPDSDRGGYGVVCEAVSGLRELTGEPDQPSTRMATSLTDYIAGLYAAFGAMMAIHERQTTGHGQVVDTSLAEGAFSFTEPHVPAFQQLGVVAKRAGARLPGNTPNSLYVTKDDRHLVMAAASDGVFRKLASAMGQPGLANDARFATALARVENADACEAIVAAWFAEHELTFLVETLREAGVPAAVVNTVEDIFADPHFAAREMIVEVDHDALGAVALTGIVPKLSRSPGSIRWAGREIGADTEDVLARELGLSRDEIVTLTRDGTVVRRS